MTRESEDRHRLGENALQDTQMTKDPCTKYERIFKTIIRWTTQFQNEQKTRTDTSQEENIQMTSKHIQTCSACYAIREL